MRIAGQIDREYPRQKIKGLKYMQAYYARYEQGQVVPVGNPIIPEGSRLILTVLDAQQSETPIEKQRSAIDRFLNEMQTCDEILSSEFDAIINQRINLSREVDL